MFYGLLCAGGSLKEGEHQDVSLSKHHSYCGTQRKKWMVPAQYNKSDLYINKNNEFESPAIRLFNKNVELSTSNNNGCGEYYKRYEHDETPVKDESCDVNSSDSGKGDRIELTESHLANLEQNIFRNISQGLVTTTSSSTLDTNTKFFKITVEEIFDKFYANMYDIEQYKHRYIEILERNRNGSVDEMEYFIKDMIHHIMSSESSDFDECRLCQVADKGTTVSNTDLSTTNGSFLLNLHSVVESFKNDNYLTDSTAEERCKIKREKKRRVNNEEVMNIFFLSKKKPWARVRMANRKLFSEININDPRIKREPRRESTASAENIKKVAAKKLQIEMYEQQNETHNRSQLPDRDIPVKMSFPKTNIHSNEDFAATCTSKQNEKSLLSRFCTYICRRLRKTL